MSTRMLALRDIFRFFGDFWANGVGSGACGAVRVYGGVVWPAGTSAGVVSLVLKNILGGALTESTRVRRSQNADGGLGAVPRVYEVPSAAWETVSVVRRRVSPVNEFVGDFCSSNREAVEAARRHAG